MTTALSNTLPTLLDLAKMQGRDGSLLPVVEAMTKQSPFLRALPWQECNDGSSHKMVTRTALPTLVWRKLNQGVPASKGRTDPVKETTGQLAGRSEVDVDLVRNPKNGPAFRASEDAAFTASFKNDLESAFFYSSQKTDPDQVHGLAPRLDAKSGAAYGNQVITSQVTGSGDDNTSAWFVNFGPKRVYGLYPEGMPTGLQMDDRGKIDVDDADGNPYPAWVTDFRWTCGFAVEDYRYVVRLASIDSGDLAKTGKLLIEDFVIAYHQVQDWEGTGAIFVNRLLSTYLHLQALDTVKNSTLTIRDIGGTPVVHFLNIPIYVTDALLNTEADIA